jgi:hypothetical protein
LDRANAGVREKWFDRELKDKVKLPGTLAGQGIGDDVSLETKWTGGIQDPQWFKSPIYAPYTKPDSFKFPFWLQPDKYYAGIAWYQREIEIPEKWKGERITLKLERPHWETTVWLDEKPIGSNRRLSVPHVYDLGIGLTGKHRLTVRVDNGMVVDIGENSHAITDHTQGNWNGIVGDLWLEATPPVWIEELQVYPDLKSGSVTVRGRLGNATGQAGSGTILLKAEEAVVRGNFGAPPPKELRVSWDENGGTFEGELPVAAKPWDEFRPAPYNVSAYLKEFDFWKSELFGFREIRAEGTQFTINGQKTFFRGTLECCIFPLTGHPPTDSESWRRVIRAAKAHGLNMIRFHSYCPPEAAFQAADFEGFYFQVETCWANQSTTIGDGKPVDQWVYDETDAILKAYGNHPSFVLMLHGNEPGGNKANAYLARWVSHYKAKDPRRLWSSGSGWPQLPENQFHVTPDPRIQGWGQGLASRINARPPETTTDCRDYIRERTVPVISHEIGQWCVYPNFDEIPKYKGYLKAKNFEIFRDTLKAHHMGDQAGDFLRASGNLQALCYKEDIESALRTPGMGGFQLLDLHDFPGQGTALVGILDPFWEYKGYITAKQFSRFCNSTVPLARMSKRVFTTDEQFEAAIEAAHFGPSPRNDALVTWKLVDAKDKTLESGRWENQTLPIGNGTQLGKVSASLRSLITPAQYKLVVKISEGSFEGVQFRGKSPDYENDWDFWVYPPAVDTRAVGVTVVDALDDQRLAALKRGGKMLLAVGPGRVKGDRLGKVAMGFSSIFWNTAWTGRQPPHTLGILCNPSSPALAQFPTEYHSNWQWWYLVSRAGAMILDDLPAQLRPTVQVIDDWVTNRRLGLLFEAKVGKGQLMVCSIDLKNESDKNPVARQFLHSVLAYMQSSRFKPSVSITETQLQNLFVKPAGSLGARIIKADSAQPGFEPENILDGNPSTMWHTSWQEPVPGFPHEVQIALPKPTRLKGLKLLPRQDNNRNGFIKEYEIFAGTEEGNWGTPVARGTFTGGSSEKTVDFPSPVQARFVRIVALSNHSTGPWASLAEVEFVE